MIALGAMKALREMGYRIPDDVSVAGFDDLPFSEISTPALTTSGSKQRDGENGCTPHFRDDRGDRDRCSNKNSGMSENRVS